MTSSRLIVRKGIDGRYEYAVGIATNVGLLLVLVVLTLPIVRCSPLPLLVKINGCQNSKFYS